MVKHAELVEAEMPDPAFELLRAGTTHAYAAPREALLDYSAKLPGSRVLADAYRANTVGLAVQKGRGERLAYVIEFIAAAKTSGLIRRAIDDAGLRGVRVAAPSKPE